MLTLGIDEVARGCVVGSMFIAGALFEEQDLELLRGMGIKDSKKLTHKKRIELSGKINKIAKKSMIIEVKPDEIDKALESDGEMNLNWLEAKKQAKIINELEPDRAIIDCPSPNIRAYTNFLKKYIKKDLLNKVSLIVAHKADDNFLECGSASIIAKCAREEHIDKIKKKLKIDFGSGYASDPRTINFLRKYHDKFPEIFRKSWGPYRKAKNNASQSRLAEE